MTESLPTGQHAEIKKLGITADHVWSVAGPTITAAFQTELIPHVTDGLLMAYNVTDIADLNPRVRSRLQETIDGGLPREEAFVRTVSEAVLGAIESKPDASEYVVLYDLDDTTVKRDVFNRSRHIIRPAAVPLIATMHGLDPRIKRHAPEITYKQNLVILPN
jgi:hypothetical protein